jgi:DNA-3-methyladenine glycosylase II
MGRLIDDWGGPLPEQIESRRPDDRYAALVRSIAGQQLSGASARAIWGRLTGLYGGRPPTPQEILAAEPEELRVAAGFSHAKMAALRSLAEHVVSGELDLDGLDALDDAEIVRRLVAVRGIGQWTADLFLMFSLERPDVLPVGDLGIRNAAQVAYGLAQRPSPAELEAMGEVWRPYRTRASVYLWRSLRAQPL